MLFYLFIDMWAKIKRFFLLFLPFQKSYTNLEVFQCGLHYFIPKALVCDWFICLFFLIIIYFLLPVLLSFTCASMCCVWGCWHQCSNKRSWQRLSFIGSHSWPFSRHDGKGSCWFRLLQVSLMLHFFKKIFITNIILHLLLKNYVC